MSEAFDTFQERYGELTSALNALAGCIMFAPAQLKLQDGPRLAEAAQQAAFKCDMALSDLEEAAYADEEGK